MEISPILQARLLLYTALLGMCTALLCDVLWLACNALDKRRRIRAVIRFIADICIFFYAGAGVVLLSFYFNKGIVRFFCVLGLAGGFFIYKATLSKAVRHVLKWLCCLILHMICTILRPFAKFFKKLVSFSQKIKYYIHKTLAKITILVYNIIIRDSILKKAKKGFLK